MENDKDIECKCPIQYTLNLIGGKWKLVILWHLTKESIMRYGEVKKCLTGITHKMLSQQLKELEADGLIHREEYHQIPPKVEYSLTDLGKSLLPILESMYLWGNEKINFKEGV